MTIRDYLKSIGATDANLSAKVVDLMEQRMMFDTDLESMTADTVKDVLLRATDALSSAAYQLKKQSENGENAANRLERTLAKAKGEIDRLEAVKSEVTTGIENVAISDRNVMDAVIAYGAILNVTKQVFEPENMTEDVMKSAIEAGSYIAWRGIMGPKYIENNKGWR